MGPIENQAAFFGSPSPVRAVLSFQPGLAVGTDPMQSTALLTMSHATSGTYPTSARSLGNHTSSS
jgi:hypothetical protein